MESFEDWISIRRRLSHAETPKSSKVAFDDNGIRVREQIIARRLVFTSNENTPQESDEHRTKDPIEKYCTKCENDPNVVGSSQSRTDQSGSSDLKYTDIEIENENESLSPKMMMVAKENQPESHNLIVMKSPEKKSQKRRLNKKTKEAVQALLFLNKATVLHSGPHASAAPETTIGSLPILDDTFKKGPTSPAKLHGVSKKKRARSPNMLKKKVEKKRNKLKKDAPVATGLNDINKKDPGPLAQYNVISKKRNDLQETLNIFSSIFYNNLDKCKDIECKDDNTFHLIGMIMEQSKLKCLDIVAPIPKDKK